MRYHKPDCKVGFVIGLAHKLCKQKEAVSSGQPIDEYLPS